MDLCFPRHAEANVILGADLIDGLARERPHWEAIPFQGLDLASYFARIDFMVYFTARTFRESFGRVLAEGIAAGKVVISDAETASVFGDAVVAARPEEVDGDHRRLRCGPRPLRAQVRRAQARLPPSRPTASCAGTRPCSRRRGGRGVILLEAGPRTERAFDSKLVFAALLSERGHAVVIDEESLPETADRSHRYDAVPFLADLDEVAPILGPPDRRGGPVERHAGAAEDARACRHRAGRGARAFADHQAEVGARTRLAYALGREAVLVDLSVLGEPVPVLGVCPMAAPTGRRRRSPAERPNCSSSSRRSGSTNRRSSPFSPRSTTCRTSACRSSCRASPRTGSSGRATPRSTCSAIPRSAPPRSLSAPTSRHSSARASPASAWRSSPST
jgi:hypothetical protein